MVANPETRSAVGGLPVDPVTMGQALDAIAALVQADRGGAVVLAERDARLRHAYARANLSLVDGMPLVWAARLLGCRVPERVAGSDLVPLLLERAAERGWRIYFLGGAPGVAEQACAQLRASLPELRIVGVDAPLVRIDEPPEAREAVLARVRAAKPELVLVALGAPKQEVWIDQCRSALEPAVLLGVGASLDFVARTIPRAPVWMKSAGLEWLFRLSREPRRLWRRYLLQDPRFVGIVARQWVARRKPR
jgi:N-acetylglucosaminyldiphosphoundecaprenol N-acetyl-beta-D-mannosaminyltransferase